jgi:hypothetical protein
VGIKRKVIENVAETSNCTNNQGYLKSLLRQVVYENKSLNDHGLLIFLVGGVGGCTVLQNQFDDKREI